LRTQNAENFNRTAKQQLPFFPFLLSPQQPNGLELTCGAALMPRDLPVRLNCYQFTKCIPKPLTASTFERVHAATSG
jgi:hypothetical protein